MPAIASGAHIAQGILEPSQHAGSVRCACCPVGLDACDSNPPVSTHSDVRSSARWLTVAAGRLTYDRRSEYMALPAKT